MAVPYAVSRGVSRGVTRSVTDRLFGGAASDAALFLSLYGPYGMAMDFTDASISINDSTDVLDYNSQGTISSTTGLPLGPLSRLTYSAPSAKLTEQADGYLGFQAHNRYLNSAVPANQSITVISGATYAITITGSVSVTASGAATGTWTAGTNTFTAATGTLTLGSTSGSGTVHVRKTPSISTYVATTGAIVYDLPYVYSSGLKTGILVEPAATNLLRYSRDLTQVNWGVNSVTPLKDATGLDGEANSASSVVLTGAGGYIYQQVTSLAANTTYTLSGSVRRRSGSGGVYVMPDFLLGSAALGTETVSATEKATNGEFATDLSNWTTTIGGASTVAWSAGAAVFTRSGGNCRINQSITGLTRGKAYLVEINISSISGGAHVGVGRSANGGAFFNTTGVKKALIYLIDGTSANLVVGLFADGSATVDYVSVKEVTNGQDYLVPGSSGWAQITRTLKTGEVLQTSSIAMSPENTVDVFEFDNLQFESGTVATSPIITYGAAVTRAADNISMATTLFPLSTTAETLFSKFGLLSTASTDIAKLKPTSGIAEIFGFYHTSSMIAPIVRNGGSVTFAENSALSPVVGAHRYAMAAEANNARGALDGTLSVADVSSVTMPGTVNLLTLGAGNGAYGGSSPFLMNILAYFPERKADATLQTMTTA